MIQHTITRRALLRAGAAAVAVATFPLRVVEALAAPSSSTGTNTWTFSQWSGLVGSRFRTTPAGGRTTSLELVATSNLLHVDASSTSGPQTFALVFSGDPTPSPGEGTVGLHNEHVGSVRLFLVPGSATPHEQRYEAIVNRL